MPVRSCHAPVETTPHPPTAVPNTQNTTVTRRMLPDMAPDCLSPSLSCSCILLYPCWPPCCSLNTSSIPSSQGLCTCGNVLPDITSFKSPNVGSYKEVFVSARVLVGNRRHTFLTRMKGLVTEVCARLRKPTARFDATSRLEGAKGRNSVAGALRKL